LLKIETSTATLCNSLKDPLAKTARSLISVALREIHVWADCEREIADRSRAKSMRRNIKLGFERVEEGARRAASKAVKQKFQEMKRRLILGPSNGFYDGPLITE
jgi:hypothetical protein